MGVGGRGGAGKRPNPCRRLWLAPLWAAAVLVVLAVPASSQGRIADVQLSISAVQPYAVDAGSTFTETVTVQNTGSEASGNVTVDLAGGDAYCEVSPAGGCNNIGQLPIGAVPPGGTFTGTFSVGTTSDLGNGIVDPDLFATDGSNRASATPPWILKLDPSASPSDVAVQFVSGGADSNSLFNHQTTWEVSNLGSAPARGIMFGMNVTPSPSAENWGGSVVGGTPFLLPYLEPGASEDVTFETYTTAATTETVTMSHNETDTNTANDTASTTFTPPETGGGGGGGSGGGGGGGSSPPSAPPYAFAALLTGATQYRSYIAADIPSCLATPPICPQGVTLTSGALPPGVQLQGALLQGTPTTAGTYTFTLQAQPPPASNWTTITHTYSIVVAAFREPVSASKIPAVYSNCAHLNAKYRHGLGRVGAHDKTRGKPVKNFTHNTRLYNLAVKYNRALDTDRDGIACEKA